MAVEKIVICGTPRTGSNLLMLSLAKHPIAVCGGEWREIDFTRCDSGHWKNKTSNPDKVNLAKVFSPDPVPFVNAKTVYLYRADTAKQIESWRKASLTGEWLDGQSVEPTEFDADDAMHQIADAKTRYGDADFALSYETVISDWDVTIASILDLANWPRVALSMAIARQD